MESSHRTRDEPPPDPVFNALQAWEQNKRALIVTGHAQLLRFSRKSLEALLLASASGASSRQVSPPNRTAASPRSASAGTKELAVSSAFRRDVDDDEFADADKLLRDMSMQLRSRPPLSPPPKVVAPVVSGTETSASPDALASKVAALEAELAVLRRR